MAEKFGLPQGLMDGGFTSHGQDSPTMDAGFTFFGQFIDHNLTFDVTSMLGRQVDPEAIHNFRVPMLDLDHLYGSGPFANPHLYDTSSNNTKLILSADGADFARTPAGVALIGDPRNDENLLLNQVHLAFIKFHNQVVDALSTQKITDVFGDHLPPKPSSSVPPELPPNASIEQLLNVRSYFDTLFAKAQQIVRWHYQWIIVHEYLPLVAGQDSVDRVDEHGLQFFAPGGNPFIPVEFAVAAFRFMHPTIRSEYVINDQQQTLPLFPLDFEEPFPTDPHLRADLRGGPVAPEFAVDFTKFFAINGNRPQRARRIEAKINTRLLDLPPITDVPAEIARQLRSLAVRNLLRSETQELPSGQDIARKIGEVPLTDAELGTTGPIYLWFYILKEAELRHNGGRLGPVGALIVTEVLLGLLEADPLSYRSTYPIWTPTLADSEGNFGIADLLRFAEVVK